MPCAPAYQRASFRALIDLSSASRFNAMLRLKKHGKDLKPAVYEFPKELDNETAMAKLETMGITIDEWTEEQKGYAKTYTEGT